MRRTRLSARSDIAGAPDHQSTLPLAATLLLRRCFCQASEEDEHALPNKADSLRFDPMKYHLEL
jgi:hypothetical protein